jgi:hypothetical protein
MDYQNREGQEVRIESSDLEAFKPLVAEVVRTVLAELKRANGSSRLAYTEAEAAALLGVPRHSLRDCRLRGEIHATKVGKRLIYARSELQRLVKGE